LDKTRSDQDFREPIRDLGKVGIGYVPARRTEIVPIDRGAQIGFRGTEGSQVTRSAINSLLSGASRHSKDETKQSADRRRCGGSNK